MNTQFFKSLISQLKNKIRDVIRQIWLFCYDYKLSGLYRLISYSRRRLSPQARSLSPDAFQGQVYLDIANTLMGNSRPQDAVDYCQRAIALQPDSIDAHDRLAMAYFYQGNIDQAVAAYDKYLHVRYQQADKLQIPSLNLRMISQEVFCGIGGPGHLDSLIKADLLWRPEAPRPILLVRPDANPNWAYLNYWRKYISIISDPIAIASLGPLEHYLAERPTWMLDCQGKTTFIHTAVGIVQQQWEAEHRPPLLTLTDEDRQRGWDCLRSLGVPQDAWFVCLHVRESGFKDGKSLKETPRNADITTYIPAIQTIVEQGGWVIRLGDPSMQPLPQLPHVIDYALSPAKCDWMDVFLCATCRFFIGTSSGLYKVAISFGTPCIHTNYLPWHSIAFPAQDLYLPKLFQSIDQKRYFTFAETLASPMRECYFKYQYDALGGNPVPNTSDEIKGVVEEMMARLQGNYRYTPDQQRLHETFDGLVKQHDTFRSASRIGTAFLMKHAHLL